MTWNCSKLCRISTIYDTDAITVYAFHLQSKSIDWFLYDRDFRHKRVICFFIFSRQPARESKKRFNNHPNDTNRLIFLKLFSLIIWHKTSRHIYSKSSHFVKLWAQIFFSMNVSIDKSNCFAKLTLHYKYQHFIMFAKFMWSYGVLI